MKYPLSILLLLIIISVSSCHTNPVEKAINIESIITEKSTIPARQYIANNQFIDVKLPEPIHTQSFTDTDLAKLKAAVYRFYKDAKLENGKYVSAVKDGKEINISEELYKALYNDMENTNRGVEKSKADAGQIKSPVMTPQHLDSLLN